MHLNRNTPRLAYVFILYSLKSPGEEYNLFSDRAKVTFWEIIISIAYPWNPLMMLSLRMAETDAIIGQPEYVDPLSYILDRQVVKDHASKKWLRLTRLFLVNGYSAEWGMGTVRCPFTAAVLTRACTPSRRVIEYAFLHERSHVINVLLTVFGGYTVRRTTSHRGVSLYCSFQHKRRHIHSFMS